MKRKPSKKGRVTFTTTLNPDVVETCMKRATQYYGIRPRLNDFIEAAMAYYSYELQAQKLRIAWEGALARGDRDGQL